MNAGDYFYGNIHNENWKEYCEILCNNAYSEILRIKSLARTYSDETVTVFAGRVLTAIDALQTVCAGGNENA